MLGTGGGAGGVGRIQYKRKHTMADWVCNGLGTHSTTFEKQVGSLATNLRIGGNGVRKLYKVTGYERNLLQGERNNPKQKHSTQPQRPPCVQTCTQSHDKHTSPHSLSQ